MKKIIGSFFLLSALVFSPTLSLAAETGTSIPLPSEIQSSQNSTHTAEPTGAPDKTLAPLDTNIATTTPNLQAKTIGLNASSPIIVSEVTLEKITYNAGDTVKGTIILNNQASLDQTDVYFDISLVGDYSTKQGRYGLAETFYDTKVFGPFTAKAGVSSKIPFTYVMPKNIGGAGLGINISARSIAGVPYGWKDVRLNEVKGGKATLVFKNAYVNVDGKKHAPGAGPTVRATTTIDFHILVTNPTDKAIVVTPSIEVHDRLVSGKLIKKYTEKNVTIGAKGNYEFVLKPDLNGNVPGVYLTAVSLVDTAGEESFAPIEFRYILPGAIATIQEITFDQQTVKEGETVNVNVVYTGPPQDILSGEQEKIEDATIQVQLVNAENDEIIGESSTPADFKAEMSNSTVQVKSKNDAKSIKILSSIISKGKTLATYSTSATIPDLIKSKEIDLNDPTELILEVTILAVILMLLFYFLQKRGMSHRVIIVVIILLAVLAGIFLYTDSSKGATTLRQGIYTRCDYGYIWVWYGAPYNYYWWYLQAPGVCQSSTYHATSWLSLSQPAGATYLQGQAIPVQGTIYSSNCSNTPESVYVQTQIQNSAGVVVSSVLSYGWSYVNCAATENCGYAHNASAFSFNIPQNLAPGNYDVVVYTVDKWEGNPNWKTEAYEWYYTPITITSPPSGSHDTSSCSVSAGWTCDPDNYNTSLQVHFYDGPSSGGVTKFLGATTANLTREAAVGAVCGGNVNHGFSFSTPDSIKDGQNHSIYAYYIDIDASGQVTGNNSTLTGSPKTINCDPPAQSIPAPIVTGSTTGQVNTNYNFNAVSTLSGTTLSLKYGFDWDRDGTVDEWQPGSGYVNDGTPVTGTKSWTTTGAKTFQVKAQDGSGNVSSWTPFTITIGQNTCSNGATDYPTCTPLAEISNGANSIFSYARCPNVGSSTSTVEILWSPSSLSSPIYEVFRGSSKISETTGYNATDLDQSLGSAIEYYVHTLSNQGSGTSPVISVVPPASCSVSTPPSNDEATVKTFGAVPPLGNPGYTCTLSWELNSYRANGSSSCTITGPNGLSTSFKPVNKLGSAKVYNVTNESQFGITCEGTAGTPPIKKYATCRINPDYVEVR